MYLLNLVLLVTALGPLKVAIARPSFDAYTRPNLIKLLYQTRLLHRSDKVRLSALGVSSKYVRYGFIGNVTVDMDLPMKSEGLGGTITYIEVVNQGRSEGQANIASGGLGYNYVSIHFEADYNKDIDFVINLYGCHRGNC